MKRCPECRKDYFDDSLLYCLDDGVQLVAGSVTDEPATAILSGDPISEENKTASLGHDETTAQITAHAIRPSRILSRERLLWFSVVALVMLAAALAVALLARSGRTAAAAPLRRFTLSIPSKGAPNWNDFRVAISPDGSRIA